MAIQLTLGSVTLLSGSFSGFDLEQSRSRVAILSDGTSVRNEVIQQGSTPYRQATIAFTCETADAETIRGYYEDATEVTFANYEDESSTVLVFDFARSIVVNGLWSCTATLIELSDPVAGS
jgi:hypothetical protein